MVDQGIPSVVIGDFNYIDEPNEKRGGWPFVEDTSSKEFGKFLQYNGLVDLEFLGPRFTWCNNCSCGAKVWKRIDKIFVTPTWIQWHPTHLVPHLPRIASGHCPILLSTNSSSYWSPF